jgi:small subunit ribosomal protein S17
MPSKKKIGIVVSEKMCKTRIVKVCDRVRHKRYGKVITREKKYAVHDADSTAKVGDRVEIEQVRPISKTKRWSLVKILKKN